MSQIWKASEAPSSFSFTCQLLLLFLPAVSLGVGGGSCLAVFPAQDLDFFFPLNAFLFFFCASFIMLNQSHWLLSSS